METENKHALLGPSSAHRWLNCSGSIVLCKNILGHTNDAAKEGTRLHKVAEDTLSEYLKNETLPEVSKKDTLVEVYVDYVIQQYAYHSLFGECQVYLEQRLEQLNYKGNEQYQIFGTLDCIIETEEGLIIIDYKSGYATVEVENNPQLILYGWLAAQKFKKEVLKYVIVQRDVVKENEVSLGDKLENDKTVVTALNAQEKLNTEKFDFEQGNWCKYCPAKFSCKEYAKSISPVVAQLPDPASVSQEELAKLFTITNFLEMYIKEVKKEVDVRTIENKIPLPGFKVIQGRGQRKWINPESEILDTLKQKNYKVGDITEKKLLSYTKIEKIDEKAKELIATLVEKQPGKYKVVSNGDPGTPITQGDELPAIEYQKTKPNQLT